MATMLKLLVALGMDAKDFEKGLDKATQDAQGSAKGMESVYSSVSGKMTSIGAGMTALLTAPIMAAGVASIGAASDLNETMSKVQVVFGTSAQSVLDFGDKAATGLGMSKNAALTAAGTYGNLFVSMGMTTDKAADMSTGIVTLAGDLASFNNLAPEDVLEKLRAGLTGETEPLKSLGVNINEAVLKAKALEMGLGDGKTALDAAAKATVTYALIMEQTKTAQGDFARTSEGLANQQRIVKAQIADMSAKMGAQLLPIALKVVSAVSKLVDWFSNLSPAAQKTILIIAGIVAVIGPLITMIGGLVGAIGAISTFLAGPLAASIGAALAAAAPVIAIVVAIIAVLGLLYLAWKNNWGDIQGITKKVGNAIKGYFLKNIQSTRDFINAVNVLVSRVRVAWDAIVTAFKVLPGAIQKYLVDVFKSAVVKVVGYLMDIINPIKKFVTDVGSQFNDMKNNTLKTIADWLNGILSKIKGLLSDFLKAGQSIIDSIKSGLVAGWALVTTWLSTTLTNFLNAWKATGFLSALLQIGKDIISKISEGLAAGWSTLTTKLNDLLKSIGLGGMATAITNLLAFGASVLEKIKNGLVNAWYTFTGALSGKLGGISIADMAQTAISNILNFGAAILNKIKNGLENAWYNITNGISDKLGGLSIGDMAQKTLTALKDFADDVIEKIWNGMETAWGTWIVDNLSSIVARLPQWFKDLLGIGGSLTASNISAAAPPAVSGLSASAPNSGNTTYNIFTANNPGQVQQALTLSALMGGAA